MDEEFLLAINGEWDALLAALRDNRTLAHQTDLNGMTLLHWVCLHQDIPTEVLIKIVFANPHAVNVPNEAGHLPIDLAVQAECEERILEVLRAADKSRQEQEDLELEPEPTPRPPPSGYSPISHDNGYDYYPEDDEMGFEDQRYFANPHHHHSPYGNGSAPQRQLPQQQHSRNYESPTQNDLPLMTYGMQRKPLHSIYSGVTTQPSGLHSKSMSIAEERLRGRHLENSSKTDDFSLRLETASDSQALHSQRSNKWQPKATVAKGTAFPPRWKQSRSCHVCASRFTTLTRRRHHCRNCGFSVCNQHSTNRVPLPKFDLLDPQRVCDKCFLGGRHVNGMASVGGSVRGAMSVLSGSEHHYDQEQYDEHHYDQQHYDQQLYEQQRYDHRPQLQQQYEQHHHEQQLQPYGGRRDSFGSFRK